ncbi:MAG TPA: hypothetical protein VJ914_26340 [Pseudonocardiaceae bacterium]|nr:hypothetical protein [Pseudonocardiaceae bacterium]
MRSGLFGLLRRAATITAISGLAAGGVIALTSAPAAAETSTVISVTSWSYIDSATPHENLTSTSNNAPVGTHVDADGVAHTSKSYLTFDLSPLLGNQVSEAYLKSSETAVTDCSSKLETQAWITTPARKPTWDRQPSEVTELDGPTVNLGQCPSPLEEWFATAAIQKAAASGQRFVTIALRLPDGDQANPDDGRDYSAAATLNVMYDRPPNKPTNLSVNSAQCTSTPIWVGPSPINLRATVSDPDFESVENDVQWWPVDHPDQRTDINPISLPTELDASKLTDQTTYAWRVRSTDQEGETGPWSQVCTFKTDLTTPNAPIITSADYPPSTSGKSGGGTGIPGTFTFDANGSSDVAGFRYGFTGVPATYVPADHPGGVATLGFTPANPGYTVLTVESITESGTPSAQVSYAFYVTNNLPGVDCGPNTAYIDTPRQCTLSPAPGSDVTGYVYGFDTAPATTVAAGPDGTATVTVTPLDQFGHDTLNVQAKLSNGDTTGINPALVGSNPGQPKVTASQSEVFAGTPVQFTFTATLPNSQSFTYTLNNAAPVTVPVGADGTATVTFTPATEGFDGVDVFSTDANGVKSGTGDGAVFVDATTPTVASTQYPPGSASGEPGIPGTFTFSSPVPNVVSYTYTFDGGAPVTVPAAADGTASVTLTPNATNNPQVLLVTSTLPGGGTSEQADYEFHLDIAQPIVSCPSTTVGQQFQCSLQPGQKNVVSYVYAFDGAPNVTLPAAADGTATITLTAPNTAGNYPLTVWSVDSGGLMSDFNGGQIFVGAGS